MPGPNWAYLVKVEDVPESGLQVAFAADEPTRAALAKLGGVRAFKRVEACFDVQRAGNQGLHISGEVSATVEQDCVITLEPVENEIREAVEVDFRPVGSADFAGDEPPEPLIDGCADLGAVATEFVLLGIDPYPRKPGAVFELPSEAVAETGAFAALAALKRDRTRK